MIELSQPELAFAVIAIVLMLIPLAIWAVADLDRQVTLHRRLRPMAQKRSGR